MMMSSLPKPALNLLDASTSTNILKVLGDSGDKVNAAGFSDSAIDRTVDGITYDIYTHGDANTSANVELWEYAFA
jgi:hypothetical protein